MEHLVIITPKGGSFDEYLSTFTALYKKNAASAYFVYYSYVGALSAKDKVTDILSHRNFKEFSLDKETNYYRLKVHIE